MSKCWNSFKASDQQRDQGEPALIAGLARELLLTCALDCGRVYVGGVSAGCAMAEGGGEMIGHRFNPR
jgi:poly(3-hydroxybutyrate) depolymerase